MTNKLYFLIILKTSSPTQLSLYNIEKDFLNNSNVSGSFQENEKDSLEDSCEYAKIWFPFFYQNQSDFGIELEESSTELEELSEAISTILEKSSSEKPLELLTGKIEKSSSEKPLELLTEKNTLKDQETSDSFFEMINFYNNNLSQNDCNKELHFSYNYEFLNYFQIQTKKLYSNIEFLKFQNSIIYNHIHDFQLFLISIKGKNLKDEIINLENENNKIQRLLENKSENFKQVREMISTISEKGISAHYDIAFLDSRIISIRKKLNNQIDELKKLKTAKNLRFFVFFFEKNMLKLENELKEEIDEIINQKKFLKRDSSFFYQDNFFLSEIACLEAKLKNFKETLKKINSNFQSLYNDNILKIEQLNQDLDEIKKICKVK